MSSELKTFLIVAFLALAIRVFAQFLPKSQRPTKNSDIYIGLRNQILNASREKLGLPAAAHASDPWAVMMDWGVDRGTATVVAICDGNASVYLSSGGGSIGGGQSSEAFRTTAKQAVAIAAEMQTQMQLVTTYPLPKRGEVTFYNLTDAGIFSATAPEVELRAHTHGLSKLGDAFQAIITHYRLAESAH